MARARKADTMRQLSRTLTILATVEVVWESLAPPLRRVCAVAETSTFSAERRGVSADRRKKSRGGRRATDPRDPWRWRRVAWLFAAYAAYLSLRSLTSTVKGYLLRRTM